MKEGAEKVAKKKGGGGKVVPGGKREWYRWYLLTRRPSVLQIGLGLMKSAGSEAGRASGGPVANSMAIKRCYKT